MSLAKQDIERLDIDLDRLWAQGARRRDEFLYEWEKTAVNMWTDVLSEEAELGARNVNW